MKVNYLPSVVLLVQQVHSYERVPLAQPLAVA
jgi:hypothetical protein